MIRRFARPYREFHLRLTTGRRSWSIVRGVVCFFWEERQSHRNRGATRGCWRNWRGSQIAWWWHPPSGSAIGGTKAARRWRFLFLSGAEDERIPQLTVKGAAAMLRQAGCRVEMNLCAREDHFLLFSQPASVLSAVGAFMKGEEGRVGGPAESEP